MKHWSSKPWPPLSEYRASSLKLAISWQKLLLPLLSQPHQQPLTRRQETNVLCAKPMYISLKVQQIHWLNVKQAISGRFVVWPEQFCTRQMFENVCLARPRAYDPQKKIHSPMWYWKVAVNVFIVDPVGSIRVENNVQNKIIRDIRMQMIWNEQGVYQRRKWVGHCIRERLVIRHTTTSHMV